MKIIRELSELDKKPVSFTLGSYDGLHRGHAVLLNELKKVSAENGTVSLVISFYPHPRKVIDSSFNMKLLNTKEEKLEIIGRLGIGLIHFINFTKEFASMTYEEFYQKYIFSSLNVKNIVTGSNHQFGSGRKGDNSLLSKICSDKSVRLITLPPLLYGGKNISSTRIRHSILEGKVEEASEMLGYDYSVSGRVVRGKGAGSGLGFPTANLNLNESEKVLPLNGVYATRTIINGKKYGGVSNLGTSPTLGGIGISFETFLFGLGSNIYGEMIRVEFVKRLRDEIKFSSVKKLKEAVTSDIAEAGKIITPEGVKI